MGMSPSNSPGDTKYGTGPETSLLCVTHLPTSLGCWMLSVQTSVSFWKARDDPEVDEAVREGTTTVAPHPRHLPRLPANSSPTLCDRPHKQRTMIAITLLLQETPSEMASTSNRRCGAKRLAGWEAIVPVSIGIVKARVTSLFGIWRKSCESPLRSLHAPVDFADRWRLRRDGCHSASRSKQTCSVYRCGNRTRNRNSAVRTGFLPDPSSPFGWGHREGSMSQTNGQQTSQHRSFTNAIISRWRQRSTAEQLVAAIRRAASFSLDSRLSSRNYWPTQGADLPARGTSHPPVVG